jgi:hypothetical protein
MITAIDTLTSEKLFSGRVSLGISGLRDVAVVAVVATANDSVSTSSMRRRSSCIRRPAVQKADDGDRSRWLSGQSRRLGARQDVAWLGAGIVDIEKTG